MVNIINKAKVVIFDLDGTIVNSEHIYKRAALRAAGECGYVITDYIYSLIENKSDEDASKILSNEFKNHFPRIKFLNKWKNHTRLLMNSETPVVLNGVKELIYHLRMNSIFVALATSNSRENTDLILKENNIDQLFDCIVTKNDVANSKPYPDTYTRVLMELGIQKQDAVVIEDSLDGFNSAYRAGIKNIVMVGNVDYSVIGRNVKLAHDIETLAKSTMLLANNIEYRI